MGKKDKKDKKNKKAKKEDKREDNNEKISEVQSIVQLNTQVEQPNISPQVSTEGSKEGSDDEKSELTVAKSLVISGHGLPYEQIEEPINGTTYVDLETANTYLYVEALGWINQSSWQPDVGEGPPTDDRAPPNPLTGDQYIDILSGDFYFYSEGMGWILGNGIEGPQGPQGPTFHFDLVSTVGPTGPVISGPLRVESGSKVQMWINSEGLLCFDVCP